MNSVVRQLRDFAFHQRRVKSRSHEHFSREAEMIVWKKGLPHFLNES